MRPLLTESEILAGVSALAERISRRYSGQLLTLVGLLNGSIPFLADLMRRVTIPVEIETIRVSSYRGATTTPVELRIEDRCALPVVGRHVLLVDEIFDTGRTMQGVVERSRDWGAASVRTAVLLWKRERSLPGARPDEFVFEIPDHFVVGYGLDYNGAHRHLPAIMVLEPPATGPQADLV